jgi:MFS family permease
MRRVLLLVSAIVLVDTSFYAAITPLLPYYAVKLELSKAAAGALAAAYPAGTMIAALPCGWIAARIGSVRMLILGLALLAVSSLTFGFASELWLLDVARFAQGVGGAASWTGGMAWLSSSAPRERRTELVATAFGAALGGALLGPVVGALARSAGTGATFTGVAAIASGLLVFTLRENAATRGDVMPADVAGGFTQAFRQPLIVGGAWLVGMSALMFGVLDVLLPLKMGRLGASGALIAWSARRRSRWSRRSPTPSACWRRSASSPDRWPASCGFRASPCSPRGPTAPASTTRMRSLFRT